MKAVLIIGQGLIGTLAAWELRLKNIPFCIVDGDFAGSASAVAAGLINPIMGPKLKLVPNLKQTLKYAKDLYEKISNILETNLFEDQKISRIFDSKEQLELYQSLKNDPQYQNYWGHYSPPYTLGNDPYGSVEVLQAGILNIPTLLSKSRALWQKEGNFLQYNFQHETLFSKENSKWEWKEKIYEHVIFAEGLGAQKNPFFANTPLRPTAGEIFTFQVRIPDNCQSIWLKKNWLIPIDKTTCKIGATYRWTDDPTPNAQSTAELTQAFREFLPRESLPIILAKQSGVRMCSPDTQPIVIPHSQYPELLFANGFGSKGALLGPLLIHEFINIHIPALI